MLAYVFWRRPKDDVDREAYEAAQREFHRTLDIASACFRLAKLPFAESSGYEDWYLVRCRAAGCPTRTWWRFRSNPGAFRRAPLTLVYLTIATGGLGFP